MKKQFLSLVLVLCMVLSLFTITAFAATDNSAVTGDQSESAVVTPDDGEEAGDDAEETDPGESDPGESDPGESDPGEKGDDPEEKGDDPEEKGDDPEETQRFIDVPEGKFYTEAVAWAVSKGVTNGISETMFGPNNGCTRGEIVTMIWRYAGMPKATEASPFTDLDAERFYVDAVNWAYEAGVTKGISDTEFGPDLECTRAQAITLLCRYVKGTAAAEQTCFTDVVSGSFYDAAVDWAVEAEVTNGTTATTFSPNETCTRGQIVTFLYRCFAD